MQRQSNEQQNVKYVEDMSNLERGMKINMSQISSVIRWTEKGYLLSVIWYNETSTMID